MRNLLEAIMLKAPIFETFMLELDLLEATVLENFILSLEGTFVGGY